MSVISNPNPFDVLNLVENDVDMGTNVLTSNLASKEANSSGSSFWNVRSSSIKKVSYGTNSLLEQWRETYENADYDYDPYDDDMYKGQEISDNIQSICDNLDIKLRESRALIDTFLKEYSDKDYELILSMYGKAAKLEKQMDAKLAWLLEKYYYHSQKYIGGSSSHTHEIGDVYLTAEELHQLNLDEEALKKTLEEQAMDEKAWEEKIHRKQAEDGEFFFVFGVVRYDSEYDSLD
ncbi:hypothetical protein Tco_1165961 [Tanacetum coccineum]